MLESPIVKEQYVIGTDTTFDFGVKIFDPADVSCYVYNPDTKTETRLYSGTDFSVGLKPGTTDYENGARITLLTEQPANGKLTIIRSVVPAQRVALPNFGKIPSESLETQLDRTEATVQQLTETVQLCYKIPYGQSGTVSPEDSIRKIVQEMGGGGSGGSMSFADSAGHATLAGGLDSGVVVDSAGHATLAGGLDSGVVVDSAALAGAASIAGSAAVAGSASSAGYASSARYVGPFQVTQAAFSSGGIGQLRISPGNVSVDGSSFPVGSYGYVNVSASSGTIYFVGSSGASGYAFSYQTTEPSYAQGQFYVRIGEWENNNIKQIQFGDIVSIPTVQSSGGGSEFIVPNYLALDANNSYYSRLSPDTIYKAEANGYLRISVYNNNATDGCLKLTVYVPYSEGVNSGYSSASLGMFQFASNAGGVTWPNIPMSSGYAFKISSPPSGAQVLVMYDHSVTEINI